MIAFSFWPIHVYRYGIMYAVSFLLGYAMLIWWQKQGRYKKYPFLDSLIANDIDSLVIAVLLGVMIGGRLWHILIYDLAYFITHPAKILAYSEWGMSFIGGIIGTILVVGCRSYQLSIKNSDWFLHNTLSLLDLLMPMIPVGVFFGRFGNFLNQELYGVVIPTDFRWLPDRFVNFCQTTHFFHIYNHIGPELRLNTNFLSMIFEGLVISIIIWYFFIRFWRDKKLAAWQLSAIWLGCYSMVRFAFEYLRQDSQAEFVGWFTRSQWFFVGFMIVALVVFVRQGRQENKSININE